MEVFEKLYTPIIFALAQIKESEDGHWNGDCCVDSEGLWRPCISFEFIITLVVVREGMSYIKPATVKLQREDNDIVKVYSQVHILKTALKQARISVEQKHHAYFNRAKELGEAVGTVPEKRRTC